MKRPITYHRKFSIAHVMKFKSPLLTDWDAIFDEIDSYGLDDVTLPLVFDIAELGERTYPKFERSR